jgi:hypothetical protein
VLAFVRAWIDDIEELYTLDEVWMQISGVLPKWSNWRSFKQIASSLRQNAEDRLEFFLNEWSNITKKVNNNNNLNTEGVTFNRCLIKICTGN